MTKEGKKIIFNVIKIMIGCFVFAVAVNMFALPNKLGEGGVTGITMILYYTHNISPAVTNILFNAVILVIGWKLLDKQTILYTILAVGILSVFLKFTEGLQFVADEGIVAAIAAGGLMGLGMGFIMKGEGTTAGSMILAKIMNKFLGWKVSYALLFFDIIVVITSLSVIGIEKFLLTIVSLMISTKVLDFILEGSNPKKTVMIVSDHYEEIALAIDQKISRGITLLNGVGYYKREPKKILYVVISRDQLMAIQNLINDIDPLAFVTISDAQSVIGEGFTREMFIDTEETGDSY
ncbi:YitT family protein [Vagococcus elongatus]|uniref:DUF2179 domain-containing protein n=1 Tax=Vagococcus elongatus TaxID=180344 RepID=A0A430AZU6_9ENTE|nr:YitT family protein [Vagococcus elongatus]RSU13556.1 hypothetical protein CBF29_04705 [Vagococcus elongatus]